MRVQEARKYQQTDSSDELAQNLKCKLIQAEFTSIRARKLAFVILGPDASQIPDCLKKIGFDVITVPSNEESDFAIIKKTLQRWLTTTADLTADDLVPPIFLFCHLGFVVKDPSKPQDSLMITTGSASSPTVRDDSTFTSIRLIGLFVHRTRH